VNVKIRYFARIREIVKRKEELLDVAEGATVGTVLEELKSRHGEEFASLLERATIQFLVNGISIRSLKGYKTELREGDVLAIIPPVGGGK
jgi:molybdopterin synthase sulfur carrier subunit